MKKYLNISRTKQKTFLLGLGTQKAGTSWLHDFLQGIEGVNMGFTKEYHIFDRIEFEEHLMEQEFKKLKTITTKEQIITSSNFLKRLSFMGNLNNYYEYFGGLLKEKRTFLTGDITPTYSLLSEMTLSSIKKNFQKRNIKVKVIFLMRDPVERIWSAARMTKREGIADKKLIEVYQGKYVEMLTRYEKIIPKIRSIFSDNDIYLNFYENLFNKNTIDEVTSFLSLPKQNPNFQKFVNKSDYEEIAESDRKIVEDYYSDTYSFMQDNFRNILP